MNTPSNAVELEPGARTTPYPIVDLAKGLRGAKLDSGGLVPDPTAFDGARSFSGMVGKARHRPSLKRRKVENVLANHHHLSTQLRPGEARLSGACWIVGNGPSGQKVNALHRSDEHIISINLVADVVQPDIWVMGDALANRHLDKWVRVARKVRDHGAHGVFLPWSASAVVENFTQEGRSFFLPGFGGLWGAPHEDLIDTEIVEGMARCYCLSQSASFALWLAWWLGFRTINMIGFDQSMPADDQRFHAVGPDDATDQLPGGQQVEVEGRQVVTSGLYVIARDELDAMAMFLTEAGCRIINHSEGLPYANMEKRR